MYGKYDKIQSIAMLSTHGYFDPVPRLGRTDTGGQVVYVLELAKALARQNVPVDIFTRWFDPSQKQIDPVPDVPGVRVIRIPAGPWEFLAKEIIYDVLPELAKNMVSFIRQNGFEYDIFHGHYVDAGIVTIDVAMALNKPSFFTPHSIGAWKRELMKGDNDEMEKKYNFNHRVSEELRVFGQVNGLAVTSIVQLEKLDSLYNYTADNIVNLPPGTDIHRYRPLDPNEEALPNDLSKPYIFCLSRIDANKGHDLLLEAFDIVRKKKPEITLFIGGGSPEPQARENELIANIHRIIQEKRLQQRVNVIGYVPDDLMLPYYRQAQLFVLPSTFEPFGMTAAEAMASGTPVVASKFGGINNVIVSGSSGLLVDPANAHEFADAIIRLLDDREFARKLGKEGCETIRREYSWEAMAQKHLDFYDKFMGR